MIIADMLESRRERLAFKGLGGQVYLALAVGWLITIASLVIGNVYTVSAMVLPVAVWAALKWQQQPLPWIALVSILAANPANHLATFALNLIFVFCFIGLNMRTLQALPHWIYLVFFLALISALASMVNWGETGTNETQIAALGNYILGPFLLIPLIYHRLRNISDSNQLLLVFILVLLVPSVTLLTAAWFFGNPVLAFNASADDILGKVWHFQLGNMNISLLRTQVGILLGVIGCTVFTTIICDVDKWVRLISLIVLLLALFLLLATGSVGSTLAALVALLFTLLIATRYIQTRKYLILLPVMIAIGYTGWVQLPDEIKEYAENRYEEKVATGIDVSDRSSRWEGSARYLLKNPLGRGWALYVEPLGYYPHNDYISYGIGFGLISGLVYLFLPVALLSIMVFGGCAGNDPARLALFLAGIAALVVLLVNSLSDHLSANKWYFNVVWSIIWYCYFASRGKAELTK